MVCTVLAVFLGIGLLVYCCVIGNRGTHTENVENIYRTNFPSDGDGKICGADHSAYKYLYFTNPYDLVHSNTHAVQKSVRELVPYLQQHAIEVSTDI